MTGGDITNAMQWISALSTRPSLEAAVDDVVQKAQARLKGSPMSALFSLPLRLRVSIPGCCRCYESGCQPFR